jgi:hypothetical protein
MSSPPSGVAAGDGTPEVEGGAWDTGSGEVGGSSSGSAQPHARTPKASVVRRRTLIEDDPSPSSTRKM